MRAANSTTVTTISHKQQRFVDEYLIDFNATQAAIRAGYSEKSAYSQGERLLKNAEVAEAVKAGIKAQAERLHISADWVLMRLIRETQADLADIFTDTGALKPVKDWPLIWRQGVVAGIETQEIGGDESPLITIRKIKLSDRIRRLELMGKHIAVGAFSDKHEHTGPNGAPLAPPVFNITFPDGGPGE